MADRDSSGVPAVKMANRTWAEQSTPATPAFRRLRQKECWEFKGWPGLPRTSYLKATAIMITTDRSALGCTQHLFPSTLLVEIKGRDASSLFTPALAVKGAAPVADRKIPTAQLVTAESPQHPQTFSLSYPCVWRSHQISNRDFFGQKLFWEHIR